VGTLVHAYCHHHSDCESETGYRGIIAAMNKKIPRDCRVMDNNMKTVGFELEQ